MGILDTLLGKNEPEILENWKILEKENQLEEIKEISKTKPVVIFKHSIRCGISAHAKHKLESSWHFTENDLDFFYLDLITFRNVSNKITEVFDVFHQSPQIIIIKNGIAISNFSHQSISIEKIAKEI